MHTTQVLEVLYRSEWSPSDGLGGLVVSPTRELALQIFDELRKVGQFHIFSAGLLIGGKDVKAEQEHIHGMFTTTLGSLGCNFKSPDFLHAVMCFFYFCFRSTKQGKPPSLLSVTSLFWVTNVPAGLRILRNEHIDQLSRAPLTAYG